jgi:hypothetical protein
MLKAVAIYNIGERRQGESERQRYETSSVITETVASRSLLRPVEVLVMMATYTYDH